MRTFIIVTLAFAATVGWIAGDGGKPAAKPEAPPESAMPDWQRPRASAGSITLERGLGGHFWAGGDVAGTPLRFVVDTGATQVAISREDARRVGIDPNSLHYDQQAETAGGGSMRYASTTLPRLRIGEIQLLDVGTAVLDVPEAQPLLGQTFLGRIEKVTIEGDRMTLTKH